MPLGERVTATLVVLVASFLAWSFGGVDRWSQLTAAGGALAALVSALAPWRRSRAEPVTPLRRLARSPLAWCGLALFAYVVVQALNPSYRYERDGSIWWLVPVPSVGWLPSAMSVPWTDAGPWRSLLPWFTAWALALAASLGLRRRRAVVGVLVALAANAFALAAFGIVARAAGGTTIYGLRAAPSSEPFASFIYKNHAAAFLNLAWTLALGLAVDAFVANRRFPGRNRPVILFFFFAGTIALAVVLTGSLTGLAVLAGTALLGLPVTVWWLATAGTALPRAAVYVALVLALGLAGVGGAVTWIRLGEHLDARLSGGGFESAQARWIAATRGVAMASDRWVFGWGAGCFRYGFTKYQRASPEITQQGPTRYFWEHVHDDWLELAIELGAVGALPLVAGLASWLARVARLRPWRRPAQAWALAGCASLAVTAAVDFPLQNPAVLAFAAVIAVLLVRWAESDDRRAGDPAVT